MYLDGMDGTDATTRRYLNGKRIKYAIQSCKSSLTRSLTQFHHLLTPNHRTDHRTDLQTDVTGSSHECRRGEKFQDTIGRQAGRGARCQGALQGRSKVAEQQQNARTSRTGSPPRQSDGETDEFQRRSSDSGEASDRDRYDPVLSGSADGGGGTRVNGVGRPDETLRAVTTIRMIRGYGKNVAANPNEPRLGADRAAPLQGADSGRPSRSEQRRVPSDDMYPTDRSSRESGRHGRRSLQPEVETDPSSRQVVPEVGSSIQSNVEDPRLRRMGSSVQSNVEDPRLRRMGSSSILYPANAAQLRSVRPDDGGDLFDSTSGAEQRGQDAGFLYHSDVDSVEQDPWDTMMFSFMNPWKKPKAQIFSRKQRVSAEVLPRWLGRQRSSCGDRRWWLWRKTA